MKEFSNFIACIFVKYGITKDEDKSLYAYGLWQGVILLFNFSTVFIVGLSFRMLWQSLVFMFAYGILRIFAGGYHARTQRNCYVFSVAIIVCILCLIKYIPFNGTSNILILTISSVIIFLLAPVEDENKPLDEQEQIIYKNRARNILYTLLGLTIALLLIKLIQIASCILVALAMQAFMLILGKTKELLHHPK